MCCSLQEALADVVWWSVVCGLDELDTCIVILYTTDTLMLAKSTFKPTETEAISVTHLYSFPHLQAQEQ